MKLAKPVIQREFTGISSMLHVVALDEVPLEYSLTLNIGFLYEGRCKLVKLLDRC